MNTSQRINYIKDIAYKLDAEEWPIIDLTLKQFKLPWSEIWDGTKQSYIFDMLENATDEDIEHLAQHLGLSNNTEIKPIRHESNLWQARRFRLFISHSSKHKEKASSLQQALNHFNISSFVAHNDIEPTKEWQDEIMQALLTTDCLLAFLTKDFHNSYWTDQEIGIAIGRGILVIPVMDGQNPYGFIGKYQALPSQAEPSDLADAIAKILLNNKLTKKEMAEALVTKFEDSSNFQQAKDNIGVLEQIKYYDNKIIERIESAIKSNSQIADAYGVPAKARRLLKRLQSTIRS